MKNIFIALCVLAVGIAAGWYIWDRSEGQIPFFPNAPLEMQTRPEEQGDASDEGLRRTGGYSAPEENAGKGGVSQRSVITYTDQGFSPSDITVIRDTVIAFMNESSKYMKISTQDNGDLQTARVSPGGSFEYQFTDPGTYTYFNAEVSQHTGTVRVLN